MVAFSIALILGFLQEVSWRFVIKCFLNAHTALKLEKNFEYVLSYSCILKVCVLSMWNNNHHFGAFLLLFVFGFLLGFTELGMSVFTGVIASACVSIFTEIANNIKWHRRRYKVINGLTSVLYQHLGRVYGTHLDYISETIEDLYFLYPEVLFVLNSGVEYLYSEELGAIKRIVGYVKTINANIHRGITTSNDFEQTPNYILNGQLMSFLSSHGINVNYQNYVDPIKEVEKDPNWVLSNNLSIYVDHISEEILTLVRYGMKELDSGISLATEKKGVYKSIIANRKKFREQRKKSFMG